MDEFDTEEFDDEEFGTGEFAGSYKLFRQGERFWGLAVPIVVLLIAVAVVSGLVWGGVVQGHKSREGVDRALTTQATVLIVP